MIAAAGAAGLALCACGDTASQQHHGQRVRQLFHNGAGIIQSARVETATELRRRSLAGLVVASRPAAQTPSLDDVLKRSAVYVSEFRKQLSGIVAEETYRQDIAYTAGIRDVACSGTARACCKSDLLLVKPADSDRYVELRDVFEVDGQPVRDRQARLRRCSQTAAAGDAQIASIIEDSARYNIGSITRNINTPLMALLFLDADNQPRFKFKHVEKAKPVFSDSEDAAINESPVFRVSTEMWTIEYQERNRNTIIPGPTAATCRRTGRFWINPSNGSVLISELIVDSGGVIATVTVSYQSEPLMGFLVPVEMRESYVRPGERSRATPPTASSGRSRNNDMLGFPSPLNARRLQRDGGLCDGFCPQFVLLCALATCRRDCSRRHFLPISPAIKITATGTLSPQFALVHLFAEQGFKGYALVDCAGRIVWHYRTKDYPFGADRRKNGNFVFMDKGHGLVEVNRSGAIVHELKQRDPEHEMHHAIDRDAARHRSLSRLRYRRISPASD